MIVLGGFFARNGDRIQLNVSDAGDLTTYLGVLKKFEDSGGGVVVSWLPAELQSDEGGHAILGDAHGYNVMIVPVVKDETKVTVRLRISGSVTVDDEQTITISDDDPFGWRIFIK